MRALLAMILVAALRAQAPAPGVTLLEEARSQPVEIFADIAFQLLPQLPRDAKIGALIGIFERAGEARNRFPTRYPDVRALDALSLRTRAIRTMLALDPKKARQLFESMSRPNPPRTDCDQAVAPDVGIYMDTVEAIFRQGEFTEEEREKGVPWTLVIDSVRGAGSASEIAAAQRLAAFAHSEREKAEMVSALASALTVQDSDREFTSVPPSRLVGAIVGAGSFLSRTNLLPLFAALRSYLVRHLTASRCEASPAGPDGASEFNEAVSGRTDIVPLTPEETRAAKREGKPDAPPVDASYLALERRLKALSAVKPGEDAGKSRATPEWSVDALRLLADIEAWHGGEGQDAVKIGRDKLRLFNGMVVVASGGVIYKGAMTGSLSILGDTALLLQAPDAWVSELRSLLMLSRASTALRATVARISPNSSLEPDRGIPEQLAASRLPALSLYGRLLQLGQISTSR
ncbi:MAG: hypothetical protein ABI759_07685 [Candidatus Solibacter sp.]